VPDQRGASAAEDFAVVDELDDFSELQADAVSTAAATVASAAARTRRVRVIGDLPIR
jgi:hypothetical protein